MLQADLLSDSSSPRRLWQWGIKRRSWLWRSVSMTAAWCALGIIMGLVMSAQRGGTLIQHASFGIAGCVVLGLLGVALSIFFDRALESVVGGIVGLLIGCFFLADTPGPGGVHPTTLSLVQGALFGATCWPILSLSAQVTRLMITTIMRLVSMRRRRGAAHNA